MARVTQIQVRRDTAANWNSVNPILAAGEIGYETDTGKFKVGTGSLTWNSSALKYATDGSKLTGTITASTLATARNINGVAFNGSADITVTATPTDGTVVDASISSTLSPSKITGTATTLTQLRARTYQGSTTLDVPSREFVTAGAAPVNGIIRGYLFTPDADIAVTRISYYVTGAASYSATGSTATGTSGTNTITMSAGTGTGGAWSQTGAIPTTGMSITAASGIPAGTTISSYNSSTYVITLSQNLTGPVSGTVTIATVNPYAVAGLYTVTDKFYPLVSSASTSAPFGTVSQLETFTVSSTNLSAGNTYAVALLTKWTGAPTTAGQLAYPPINGGNLAALSPQVTFTYGTTGSQSDLNTTLTSPGGTNTPYYARLNL
jgi:hypothetical protein